MQTGAAPVLSDSLAGLSDPEVLALVDAGLERLRFTVLGADVDDETLRDSVSGLQRCESKLYAEKLRRIATIDERHAFRSDGHRSTADWVADRCGVSLSEARRQVGTAGALAQLPDATAQLASGAITPGHADAAAHGLRDLARQSAQRRHDAGEDIDAYNDAVRVEEQLTSEFDRLVADKAPTMDRSALRKRIEAWTIAHDPDVVDDRDRLALRHRSVMLAQRRNTKGLWSHRLDLDDAANAQFLAVVEPLARKTSADDERTRGQRLHDAVAQMAGLAATTLPTSDGAMQRAQVLVIDTQQRRDGEPGAEPALVDGIGPVSAATAELFACDADTTTITKDADGQIWDVGHADGDPTTKQRKAVIARDKSCVGCGTPASRCHLHHIKWRRNGGGTYTANLVLLCWSCHQGVHHLGWNVTGNHLTGFTLDRHPVPSSTVTGPPRHSH